MRFVMVDAHEWLPQGKRDGLRRFESDEQGHRQTRPLRGSNSVELSRRHTRIA
jgi:hypothetical protein